MKKNGFNWEKANRRALQRRSAIEVQDNAARIRRRVIRDKIARRIARKEAKRLAEVAARIRQIMYREENN